MVDFATIGLSVSASVVGSIFVTEYKLRRQMSVEEDVAVDEWYDDCAGYAAEVRRTWQRLFDNAEHYSMNLSEIQSQMELLEGQLSRHASNGEQLGADQAVIDALDSLAEECRRPASVSIHNNSVSEFQEYRADILEAVDAVEQTLDNR